MFGYDLSAGISHPQRADRAGHTNDMILIWLLLGSGFLMFLSLPESDMSVTLRTLAVCTMLTVAALWLGFALQVKHSKQRTVLLYLATVPIACALMALWIPLPASISFQNKLPGQVFAAFTTLLFAVLLVAALKRVSQEDFFAPGAGFPLTMVAVLCIGSLNFLPDLYPRPEWALIHWAHWRYYVYALAAYSVGIAIIRNRSAAADELPAKDELTKRIDVSALWIAVAGLFFLAVVIQVYMIKKFGFLAFGREAYELSTEALRTGHGNKLNFLRLVFLRSTLILIATYLFLVRGASTIGRITAVLISMVVAVFLLFRASRSDLVLPLITVAVFAHYAWRRYSFKVLLVGPLVALLALGAWGELRAWQQGNVWHQVWLEWVGFPEFLFPVAGAYMYVTQPVHVFYQLTQLIPVTMPFFKGEVFIYPFLTLLPGEQRIPDLMFKEALGYEYSGGLGTPATLLGQFYVDGGAVAVLIGMLATGLIVMWCYRYMLARRTLFSVWLYAHVMQTAFFAIYASVFPFFDTIFIPLLLYAIFLWVERARPTDAGTYSRSTLSTS